MTLALLIEDNPDDVVNVCQVIGENGIEVLHADCLKTGLKKLNAKAVDVVLLDLGLPDSKGVETIQAVHAEAPDVPVVVLTGREDDEVAIAAVHSGAQDYLSKKGLQKEILVRAIRYAIERLNLQKELARSRQELERERELTELAHLASSGLTSVTAEALGVLPLRKAAQASFDELARKYGELLDQALEQRTYKVQHNIPAELREMGQEMGFLGAGPRDVVDVHSSAIAEKAKNNPSQKVQAFMEEGRLLVLKLMGMVLSYYRDLSSGLRETKQIRKQERATHG